MQWRRVRLKGRLRDAYWAGWTDAKHGLPMSREFETNITLQSFYEDGRLDRCNVDLAGLTVIWDGSQAGVDNIYVQTRRAEKLVGRCDP